VWLRLLFALFLPLQKRPRAVRLHAGLKLVATIVTRQFTQHLSKHAWSERAQPFTNAALLHTIDG